MFIPCCSSDYQDSDFRRKYDLLKPKIINMRGHMMIHDVEICSWSVRHRTRNILEWLSCTRETCWQSELCNKNRKIAYAWPWGTLYLIFLSACELQQTTFAVEIVGNDVSLGKPQILRMAIWALRAESPPSMSKVAHTKNDRKCCIWVGACLRPNYLNRIQEAVESPLPLGSHAVWRCCSVCDHCHGPCLIEGVYN